MVKYRQGGGLGVIFEVIIQAYLFMSPAGGSGSIQGSVLYASSNEYSLQLIRALHSCDEELLIVTSIEALGSGCPTFLRQLEISYMTQEKFLQVGFNLDLGLLPKCLVLFPLLSAANENSINKINFDTRMFAEKVDSEFNLLSPSNKKPVVIFVYSEILNHNRNSSQKQKEKLQLIFENTRFKLNSDIYTVFITRHKILNQFKASIWETFVIKNGPIFQKLQSPYNRIFMDPDDNVFCHGIDDHSKNGNCLKEDDTFHYEELTNKAARRSDFRGETIVATARNDQTQSDWMSIKIAEGNKLSLAGGSSSFLYWDLQKSLNFTDHLVIGDGVKTLSNNSLAGKTIEQINSGEADISLSQSLIVGFRAKELTFLQPTYYGRIHVFFTQPPANSIRNIVTAPFSTPLWITLISTWVFIIFAVKVGSYVKNWFRYFGRPTRIIASSNNEDGMFSSDIGMWAIAVNCQKSIPINPSSTTMKVVFIVGALCSVVTYIAYSAAIVSSLAVNIVPVKDFLDLITFKFIFTVHRSSEPFQVFLEKMIETFNLGQDVVKTSTEKEISHLLDPLKPKAFLTYPDLFYQTALQLNYSETFICDHVSKVRVSDVLYKSGMFVKKGSEFTEIFNHKLMRIKEQGYNFRYVQEYEKKNIFSCATHINKKADVIPVTFFDAFTAFLVVFIGLVTALGCMLCEILTNRYRNNIITRSRLTMI